MKKIVLTTLVCTSLVIFLASFGGNDGSKNPDGAPAGYTGSPGDGNSCTFCHGGTATTVTDWITSNIPATGYSFGVAYTITVTVSGSASDNKGFEVSPQNTSGTLLGTLTAGSGSKLVGSGKYVTHSAASTPNPSVWTFTWTAPSSGGGPVTFYGAFAVGKNNTYVSSYTVQLSTVGVDDQKSAIRFRVFPNPVTDHFMVTYHLNDPGQVNVGLYSIDGKLIRSLVQENQPAGDFSQKVNLGNSVPSGIYFVNISLGNNFVSSHKLIITQ